MKHLPRIIIKELPMRSMRFTTAGDWLLKKGTFEIQIVRLNDWRYSFIVLIHELTELAWCMKNGISPKVCDKFDMLWEKELKQGIHKSETEAGFDKRCPYRKGHIWGSRMEKIFCKILGLSWKTYCRTWDEFFKNK